MEALLTKLRKAAPARVWSLGVTLARGPSVKLERRDGPELTLRVRSPQQDVPQVVMLETASLEWSCDCPSRDDPCAHVIAAAIALRDAEKSSTELAVSVRPKRTIAYVFKRVDGGLGLERSWVSAAGAPELPSEPVKEPIEAYVQARRADIDFQLSESDTRIDRLMSRLRRGRLESTPLREILGFLHGHPRVMLEDRAVKVDTTPLLPRGRVVGSGDTISFVTEADPTLEAIVVPLLGLADGALRPLGETHLAGPRWERLPLTQRFAKPQWSELVAELIPLMEARFPVLREARGLPALERGTRPRIDLAMRTERGRISVAPELVYGRPPRLRVEKGKATYLQGAVPRRELAAEQQILTRLRDELNLVPGRRVEFAGPDAQGFLQKLERWNRNSDEAAEQFDLALRAEPVAPRLTMDGEAVEFVFETVDDDERGPARAEPRAVIEAWLSGFGQVPLLEGGFAPLPIDWLEEHGHRLLALLSARDARGVVPPALLPDLARLAEALDAPPPLGLERLRPLLEDFTKLPSAALPADLTATLRHYQRTGVDWLSFLKAAGLGAVLADDMGLGKTVQAISVLARRSLVVCPTSVVQSWEKELARFRPQLRVCTYHGPRRVFDREADVVLTSYPLLRLDHDTIAEETWNVVVLDEAQMIKNPESQSARAAFELKAEFRVSLSGTPLENRLEELWSQLHFTNPGLLGGRRDFDQRYARPIADGQAERAGELRTRVRPFVLRRMKEEVAPELPPRTDMILYAELSETERQVYTAVQLATRETVLETLATGGSVLGALEALLRLRQAACHPSLVPGQSAPTSSKMEALVEALSQVALEGHRALVFSQWTKLLDLVEGELERASLAFVRLDGSTRDRASVIDRFQAPDGPPVFLISLKAGGTGLNLTAADHVFFLDPWWNPAVEQQAADRAHRIGQDKPVFVYRIVARDTVEEKILLLQDKKRQLAAVALGEAGQAAELTRDDLLALLE